MMFIGFFNAVMGIYLFWFYRYARGREQSTRPIRVPIQHNRRKPGRNVGGEAW